MANSNDYRVLTRRGARELSVAEVEQIKGSGKILNTMVSVMLTHTAFGGFDEHFDE